MSTYGGYYGKLLRVDLSSGDTVKQALSDDLMEQYLGGRGIASKILMDELKAGIDPLGPENKIVFITGPLTGTVVPTTSRLCISAKSPLTNLPGSGFAGGSFGPELKFCGYDGLVIERKADRPVYIWIKDGDVEIRDAASLWGKDAFETEELIKKELGDLSIEVACIGQAGENLVRFASVVHHQHFLVGRRGMGAVMGAKNLKAVAVKGTKGIEVASSQKEIWKVYDQLLDIMNKNPVVSMFHDHGTAASVGMVNELGFMPTRNFQIGFFDKMSALDEKAFFTLSVKPFSCWGCPVYCRRLLKGKEVTCARPEHQTTFALGTLLENGDTEEVMRSNLLCDRYGMDSISTGGTIAFAMECFQRNIINGKDTGGLDLAWGNAKSINRLIEMIALRQGFGDILAEGSMRAAEQIGKGSARYAMQVKGLEIPGYDPRGAKGIGLNYATAPRGADHNDGWTIAEELYVEDVDRLTMDGKAELTRQIQDKSKTIDSAIFCMFALDFGYTLEFISMCITAITGMAMSPEKIEEIGDRISNLERLFALREGFRGKSDDIVPARFIEEELPFGESKGERLDLESMLGEYYRVRGWDEEGIPTARKLKELGLDEHSGLLKRGG
jgi:aldehyde:ferredoxin oxidoreductase